LVPDGIYYGVSRERPDFRLAYESAYRRRGILEASHPHPRLDARTGEASASLARAICGLASRPDRGPPADAHRDRQNHLSATPVPSSGGTAQGWSLKQLAQDIPLADAARDGVELAHRLAGSTGREAEEPTHALQA